jgi:diguanylate cyclase (GGDEF)-like protein/PAS domain S-box-containing protein
VDEFDAEPIPAERDLQALLDNVPDLIIFKDRNSRFTRVNRAYAAYVGWANPAALIGKTDADLFPSAQAMDYLADEWRVLTTGEALVGKLESRLDAKGQVRWVLTNKVPIRDTEGRITGLVGIARDITDRKHAEVALRQSDARFRSLIRNALDMITILDAEGTVRYKSPAVERVLGYQPDELVGRNVFDFIHPDEVQSVYAAFLAAVNDPKFIPIIEFRFQHCDGSWRWLESTGTNLLADAAVGGLVFNSRDITDRKEVAERFWHQAHHDPVTGLPNRTLFMDRLSQALTEGGSTSLAVFFLDLDGFKVVNDSLGHEYGDRLLVAVAERLSAQVQDGDLLARFGGDEFTILHRNVMNASEATTIAVSLLATLAAPFTLRGHTLSVSASAGVALDSATLNTPSDLLRAADVALYRAKAIGKGRSEVFNVTRDTSAFAQLDREMALRHALELHELVLHYQPKVDLITGRLVGMEALVRWQHPTAGLLLPNDFIRLAEETGLIIPLGVWVLGEACRQSMAWQAQFPDTGPLGMCVNISPVQIRHTEFVGQVEHVLHETGFPPDQLTLEITEQGLIDDTPAIDRTMAGLKALGVKRAIDDFGAHQAGIGYLRRWPMDMLKLDQSLVHTLEQDERSLAIVTAAVGLAQTLGMVVIGEGIETAEQVAQLRELGCACGQGYLFASPKPPEELVTVFEQEAASLSRGYT